MKKISYKIEQNEKNIILEMHKNKGYRTIIEEDDDLLKLLDKGEDEDEDVDLYDDGDQISYLDYDNDINDKFDKFGFSDDHEDKHSDENFMGHSMSSDSDEFEFELDEDLDEFGDLPDDEMSNDEFLSIYNKSEEMFESEEKTKEKTKEKEKQKGKENDSPFKIPKEGPNTRPKAKKGKVKESYRLTESELISLIKRAIRETK